MSNLIQPDSRIDVEYPSFAISRGIKPINDDFMRIDGQGPIGVSIDKAKRQGRIALLDAGCGIGLGLIDIKDRISSHAPIDEQSVDAVGVSV